MVTNTKKFYDITMQVFAITFVIIFAVLLSNSLTGIYESKSNFILKCREAGGVPVSSRRSVNCAKDGYIDIK